MWSIDKEKLGRIGRVAAAAGVHCYTGAGAVCALVALAAADQGNLRWAMWAVIAANLIDSTDGYIARRVGVGRILPRIDGARLDGVVDFTTSALTPVYLMYKFGSFPRPSLVWISVILVGSAIRYSRSLNPWRGEGFHRGLPVAWNYLLFYVLYVPLGSLVIAALILILTALNFVPWGFVHTRQHARFRFIGVVLLVLWWLCLAVVSQNLNAGGSVWVYVSLLFPVGYIIISSLSFVNRSPVHDGAK